MSAHETNDPTRQRPSPPPQIPPGGTPSPVPPPGHTGPPGGPPPNDTRPKPDRHPIPGGYRPPPVNHPSWPRPGTWNPPGPRNWRPRPGQFRPHSLNRPRIAWLPLNNIPSWLCTYVAQVYNFDPGCCEEAFARSRNIANFEVENCVWCGHPAC